MISIVVNKLHWDFWFAYSTFLIEFFELMIRNSIDLYGASIAMNATLLLLIEKMEI